jgi:release factor glutamine methyltransferase
MSENYYTVAMALTWGQHALEDAQITPTPALDAEILLGHATGATKEEIYFEPTTEVLEKDYHEYERLIARRKNGEPVAYIISKKEFFGIDFSVDKSVLIPRPETEELVDKALELINNNNNKKNFGVLDLGTGSGAIAISIAMSLKKWHKDHKFEYKNISIFASDISEKALNKARENAKNHEVDHEIEFIKSDLLGDIKNIKKVDLIVANLPYLDPVNRNNYAVDLSYEPHLALYAGENGMDYYQNLFGQIKKLAIKPMVIVECEEYQKEALENLYSNIICVTVD